MEYTVNHYPEKHRFEVVEDGLTAYVEYRLRGDALDIIHTIVPKNLEGRGIAATLVETAYKYAKEQGVAPFGYLFLCGCVVKTPSGVLILDRNT